MDIRDVGIPLDDDQDYEKIQINGPANILKNLNVVKNIKLDTSKGDLPSETYYFDLNKSSGFPSCITSYKIPDDIVSIDNSAFKDCYWLTSLGIPESVQSKLKKGVEPSDTNYEKVLEPQPEPQSEAQQEDD